MNGHDFCSCGRPLHENECFQDEKEFKELIELEKIKKCPKCGFLIKKNRGCNHMTCGNPLCKYEFCWLCMNEAVPNHYDFGPCAGRQFFDPDSLSYYLEQNYPYLGYIYNFLSFLFSLILFALCFIVIPAISLITFSYGVIFESREFNFDNNNMVRKVTFLICLCLAFCYQSIIYIFWILAFSVLAFITFVLIIIGIHYFIFKVILGRNTEELLNINEIELQNSINNNNNNNNNENENNNNNNIENDLKIYLFLFK